MHYMCKIGLQDSWVQACDVTRDSSFVASGGLDRTISIFEIYKRNGRELPKRSESFILNDFPSTATINCIKFLEQKCERVIGGSSDGIIRLWDIQKRKIIQKFSIKGDYKSNSVKCISLFDKDTFLSGDEKGNISLWDIRTDQCVLKYENVHEDGVSKIGLFPNRNMFLSGGNDFTCKLIELRSKKILQTFDCDVAVTDLAIMPAGSHFAMIGGTQLCIFNMFTGKMTNRILRREAHNTSISICGNEGEKLLVVGDSMSNLIVYGKQN